MTVRSKSQSPFFSLRLQRSNIPGQRYLIDFGDFGIDPSFLGFHNQPSWPHSAVAATPSSFDTEFLGGMDVLDVLAIVLSCQRRPLVHMERLQSERMPDT